MEKWKQAMLVFLRAAGLLALTAALIGLLFILEGKGSVEPAGIWFVGTAGDADCAVLLSRGQCVVIDTGEEADGPRILEFLERKQVSKIDCLILTHPDKDHIGSAPLLLESMSVEMIVMPYYMKDNDRLQALEDQMEQSGAPVMTLSRSREFVFGDLDLRIFPPDRINYNKDNNYSLITLAEHGSVRMLFAGDAQRVRLEEMENYELEPVDLYKVPHHGRRSEKGEEAIRQLKPEIAVVTAETADPGIAGALREENAQIFYTVPDRDCSFESDGEKLREID